MKAAITTTVAAVTLAFFITVGFRNFGSMSATERAQ
jgi:hypothetical protein